MKKKKIIIGSIILGVIFILGISIYFSYQNSIDKTKYITDHDYLYDIAIEYFRNQNDDSYQTEEDYQQLIAYHGFGVSTDDDYQYAYICINETSYYVKDGNLYSGSGSYNTPYKFTFKNDEVIKMESTGEGFTDPTPKQLLPKTIYNSFTNFIQNGDYKLLNNEIEQQMKEHYSYLKSTEVN